MGRPAKYPWDEWLDGEPWELFAGEDYNTLASSLLWLARRQARLRGMTLRSSINDNGLMIRLQAVAKEESK